MQFLFCFIENKLKSHKQICSSHNNLTLPIVGIYIMNLNLMCNLTLFSASYKILNAIAASKLIVLVTQLFSLRSFFLLLQVSMITIKSIKTSRFYASNKKRFCQTIVLPSFVISNVMK